MQQEIAKLFHENPDEQWDKFEAIARTAYNAGMRNMYIQEEGYVATIYKLIEMALTFHFTNSNRSWDEGTYEDEINTFFDDKVAPMDTDDRKKVLCFFDDKVAPMDTDDRKKVLCFFDANQTYTDNIKIRAFEHILYNGQELTNGAKSPMVERAMTGNLSPNDDSIIWMIWEEIRQARTIPGMANNLRYVHEQIGAAIKALESIQY